MAYRPLCGAEAPALFLIEDASGAPSVHLSQNYVAEAARLAQAGTVLLAVPLPPLLPQTVLLEAMGGLARMAEEKAWANACQTIDVIGDWKTAFRGMEGFLAAADPLSVLAGGELSAEWALVEDLAAVWGAASAASVNQRVTNFMAGRLSGAPALFRASDYLELAGSRLAKAWKTAGREGFAAAMPAVVRTIDRQLQSGRDRALSERTFGALTMAVAESKESREAGQ